MYNVRKNSNFQSLNTPLLLSGHLKDICRVYTIPLKSNISRILWINVVSIRSKSSELIFRKVHTPVLFKGCVHYTKAYCV